MSVSTDASNTEHTESSIGPLNVLLRLPRGYGKVQIEIQGVSFHGGETDAA